MTTSMFDDAPTIHPTQRPVAIDIVRGKPALQEARRHLVAGASMAVGTVLVLGLVVAMNSAVTAPKAPPKEAVAQFEVHKPPPPKKQHKPRPKRTRKLKSTSAPRAPLPNLATAVGGVSFFLPGIEAANLGGPPQQLLQNASKYTAMTADAVDEPPMYEGTPVDIWVDRTVRFELN